MRFISSLDQHPEVRKERFPEHLWPCGNDSKDLDEGWIFLEFANAACIDVKSAPTKLQPPKPDFECVIAGKQVLFELGEILESDFAEGLAFSGQQAHKKMEALSRGDAETANCIQTAGMRSFPANASLERILRQKLAKSYETNGAPAHLVLFYDRQWPWGPFDHLLQLQNELASLIAKSVFQRVWIFYLQASIIMGYLHVRDGALQVLFDWQFHFDAGAPFEGLVPAVGERPDEIRQFVPVLTTANAKNNRGQPRRR